MQVDYIDHMGDDLTIVNVAKVSNDKWDKEWDPERHTPLIEYLARNDHWTPFGHPQIQIRVTVPIYVANQLKRHVVGACLNEVSRRYVKTEPEIEFPVIWREEPPPGKNKQGSGDPFDEDTQKEINDRIEFFQTEAENMYDELVNRFKVAGEQARTVLPMAMHTSWVWTGSLYFYARLCQRRLHSHAQSETRDVALAIASIIEPLFPVAWPVLVNPETLKS